MATGTDSTTQCPFVGLQPFTRGQSEYFFGRERDQKVIFNSLYASPVTVLYGPSGVGKSSVLRAGVVPLVEDELGPAPTAAADAAKPRPRGALVYYNRWIPPREGARFCADELKDLCVAAARRACPELPDGAARPRDFGELLLNLGGALRRPILIILDQFEEYLLYNREVTAGRSFDDELAAAVNQERVHVHFLLSLREDALSKLDRYRTRIPNLLGNTLRLRPLNREQAARAIREPLRVHNGKFRSGAARQPVTVDDDLVDEVLSKVGADRNEFAESAGVARTLDAEGDQVEAAFLQLVMTRVWESEMAAGSSRLRLATLRDLGGVDDVIKTHLDRAMGSLSHEQRRIAARLFPFLVTPSGTKFAQLPADLALSVEHDPEEVSALLKALAEANVLRRLFPPERYEVLHDKLALAVLDWRRRFTLQLAREEAAENAARGAQAKQEKYRQEEKMRQMRRYLVGAAISLALVGSFGTVALVQSKRAERQSRLAEERSRVAREAVEREKEAMTREEAQKIEKQRCADAYLVAGKLLECARNALLQDDFDLSLRYSLQAYRIQKKYDKGSTVTTKPVAWTDAATWQAYAYATSREYRTRWTQASPESAGNIGNVAFSRDGTKLFCTEKGEIYLWDTSTGAKVKAPKVNWPGDVFSPGAILSPDGLRIATWGSEPMVYSKSDSGDWHPTRVRDAIPFRTACFGNDGRSVAFGNSRKGIDIVDSRTGDTTSSILTSDGPIYAYSIAMSDDGKYVAALTFGDRPPPASQPSSSPSARPINRGEDVPFWFKLTVWEAASGRVIWKRDVDPPGISNVVFQPGTDTLATFADHKVAMFKPSDDLSRFVQLDNSFELSQLPRGSYGLATIGISADGRRIGAVVGSRISVWDTSSQGEAETFTALNSNVLAFGPDLSSFAVPSSRSGLRLVRFPPRNCTIATLAGERANDRPGAEEYGVALNGLNGDLDGGIEAARDGKIEAAIAEFEVAIKFPGIEFDPREQAVAIAAKAAREKFSASLVEVGELMTEGRVDEAIGKAKDLAASTPVERDLPESARRWNQICWRGSLWGRGRDVLFAGERAVLLDPTNTEYRDSRGMAYAEAGEFQRAVEDFQSFVDGNDSTEERRRMRVPWIESLKKNENPFTDGFLRSFRKDEGLPENPAKP